MTTNLRIAAVTAVALASSIVLFAVYVRHASQPAQLARSLAGVNAPADSTIERAILSSRLTIENLSVRSAGGIVILRGSGDAEAAQRAVDIVKSFGVSRVANLIRHETIDDEAIRRAAERELAGTAALDGCLLRVECRNGVLSVSGTVQRELQKDAARMALRNIRGAREVKVNLSTSS
ncbi:MAG TPA: BON domain-containing protein [Thermoanaerobaculia bacterium]|nr:BON domain-containing protein [Thermoanaerobaculia bacterium]